MLRPVYFNFPSVLMHLVQAKTLLPANFLKACFFMPKGIRTHCKLGYFLFLMVGLYFPRSFLIFPTNFPVLPQIVHCRAINLFYQEILIFTSFNSVLY